MQSTSAHLFSQVLEGGPIPPQWAHAIRRHSVLDPVNRSGPTEAALASAQDAKHAESERKKAAVQGQVMRGVDTINAIAKALGMVPKTVRYKLDELAAENKVKKAGKRGYEYVWVPA